MAGQRVDLGIRLFFQCDRDAVFERGRAVPVALIVEYYDVCHLASRGQCVDSEEVNPAAADKPADTSRLVTDSDESADRRGAADRRRRFWWGVLYGSFNPRRRAPRRIDGGGFHLVDWHDSHLLAVVMAILVLCVSDAFLTLILLQSGAHEANPVMASFVYDDVKTFTVIKMLMTSTSVAVMVLLAGYRFLGVFRVEMLLYLVLTGYLALVGYELWMMRELGNFPLFSD